MCSDAPIWQEETATAKNVALGSSGAVVPASFDELGDKIRKVKTGTIVPKAEVPPPPVPMDYNWARELGLIRKPASSARSCSTPGSPSRRCSGRTWASAACSRCSGSSGGCRPKPASSWRCV